MWSVHLILRIFVDFHGNIWNIQIKDITSQS